jgi:hypothetical protein
VAARRAPIPFQPEAARRAQTDPDFAIAVHEAAHAVCGIARGIRVAHAVLCGAIGNPTGGYVCERDVLPVEAELAFFDCCRMDDDDTPPALPRDPLSTLIYHASGNVCWTVLEIRGQSDADARHVERLAGVIVREAPYTPRKGYSKRVKALVQLMEFEARGLVIYHFPWIARVAARLVEQRRVSGAEIRALRPQWQANGRGRPRTEEIRHAAETDLHD